MGRLGAQATRARASTPSTAPPVMTWRGPWASRIRPTRIPATAETISPAEKAPVIAVWLQPVSAAIGARATGSE